MSLLFCVDAVSDHVTPLYCVLTCLFLVITSKGINIMHSTHVIKEVRLHQGLKDVSFYPKLFLDLDLDLEVLSICPYYTPCITLKTSCLGNTGLRASLGRRMIHMHSLKHGCTGVTCYR